MLALLMLMVLSAFLVRGCLAATARRSWFGSPLLITTKRLIWFIQEQMGPESGERFAVRKHPVHLVGGGLGLDQHWVTRAGKCFSGARVVPGNLGKSSRGLKAEPAELHKQSWGSGCCWPRPGGILLMETM